jgi:putative ABC transport system ATP-binding protein
MTAVVSLRNVAKSYLRGKQQVEVLHGVDLDIAAGEFLALMGPSGSGKTTMLNLIAGLDQPSSGEVLVAGERIDRLSRAALATWRSRHIGFIFQFYNLLPVLTAEANIEVPLLLTTLSRAERALNRTHGKTVVMVTHDPKAAEYASRELHLDKGRLVDEGTRKAA